MSDKIIPVAAIYHWLPDGSCKTESLYGEVDVIPMRDMLLKLEWARHTVVGIEYNETSEWFCPSCDNDQDLGHRPGCALAALLGRIR